MLPLIANVADEPKSHSISNNDNPVGTGYQRAEPIDRLNLKRCNISIDYTFFSELAI
jgi:hypothetical protein